MTAMDASAPSFDALKAALLDLSQPMGKRTRAVFYLRSRGGKEDLQVLLEGASMLLPTTDRVRIVADLIPCWQR